MSAWARMAATALATAAPISQTSKRLWSFSVADADGVVLRQAQVAQRLDQAGALGHPRRQDHQLGPVADWSAVQAEVADDPERGRLVHA
jgi:hypothetical protein